MNLSEDRARLMRNYHLSFDSFDRIIISDIKTLTRLVTDSARLTAYFLNTAFDHLSDDGWDYLNAALDQMNIYRDLLDIDTDDESKLSMINAILNTPHLSDLSDPVNAISFTYGACDHFTPISTLAIANHTED